MLVRYEKARNLREFNKELKQSGADYHYEFYGWLSYPDGSKARGYVCTDNKTAVHTVSTWLLFGGVSMSKSTLQS